MINVRDKETDQLVGTISDDELQALVDNLEEVDGQDNDYWVDANTLEFLEGEGAPASLIEFLRRAIGTREGVEIVWSRS